MSTAPLGGPYATLADVKRRMSTADSNTSGDTDANYALASASDMINQYTGRQFGRVETASARSVRVRRGYLDTDDFWTTDDLVINGSAYVVGGTWSLEPSDGILNGVPGYPYERIVRTFGDHPIYQAYGGYAATAPTLVIARWGWAAVPGSIVQACLMLAADHLKSKDAPFGVAGFGDYVVRVRANPKVQELLDPFRRDALKVA